MLTLIALAAAAAAGAVFYLRRAVVLAEQTPTQRVETRAELRPTQHIDTQRLKAISMKKQTKVWEFNAPQGSCELGRRQQGKRIEIELGAELPSHRCGMTECHCHYRPVADHRAGERRSGDERRDFLRFETKDDRRSSVKPRRHLNTWTDAPRR